jgi:hypothetical protein
MIRTGSTLPLLLIPTRTMLLWLITSALLGLSIVILGG